MTLYCDVNRENVCMVCGNAYVGPLDDSVKYDCWGPRQHTHEKDGPCIACRAKHARERDSGNVYVGPLEAGTAAGIDADDYAALIDHARNRQVRSVRLDTMMKGVAVKLDVTFEPRERRSEKVNDDE